MSKTTLFVCQSCRQNHAESTEGPAAGALLLEQLQQRHPSWSRRSQLDIQATGCLWTCDYPCAIALSAPHKSTYVLAHIPVTVDMLEKAAEAVLDLSQLYLDSKDGTIPWKQFPEMLQTNLIARVPPLTPATTHER